MNRRTPVVLITATAIFACAPLLAADDAAFGQDLKATIALNGKTCDQVVSSKRNADSDYTATCKDGNRYRVYVNAAGRVIVEKL
jgi:hypothetical protein